MAYQRVATEKHLTAQQRAQQLTANQHKSMHSPPTRARSQDGKPVAYRKVKESTLANRQSRSLSDPEIPESLVILNARGLFQGRNGASVQNVGDITPRELTVMEKDHPVFFDPVMNDKERECVSDLKKKFEVYKGEYEANKGTVDFLNPLHKLNNDKSVINKETRYLEVVKKKVEAVISADALTTQFPGLKRNTVKNLKESSGRPSPGLGVAGRRKLPLLPPKQPPPRVPQQRFRGESDPMPFDEHRMSRIRSTAGSNVGESITEEAQCIEPANVNYNDWDDDDEPIGDPDDFDEWDSDFDSDDDKKNHDFQTSGNTSVNEVESLVFPDAASKKLYNIALEILTTERAYVRRLHLLDQVFYCRLNNECCAKGLLPVEALNEIFSNIQAIHQLHRDFLLPKLETRMKEWSTNNKIGDILKELAPFLKLYAHYIGNFDKATEALSSWTKKSVATASLIEEIQKSKECENLTLQHHMLEPVQRVPRYKLLLKDYVSKLPEDSKDLKNTSDALEIISESASHANESMKKTERFKKLLEIKEKIGEDYHLITPSREFVSEGEFIKVSARTTETHQERTLMLFNDALLCCAKFPGTNKYKVKVAMDLYGMEVSTPDEDLEVANAFRIISKQRVMDFAATSSEAMEEWIKKLEKAINELTEKRDSYRRASKIELMNEYELGKKAPVWVRDEAVSMCMLCDVMFTAIRRRHHCRACGRVVCRSCSAFKAALEYDTGKQNRVCEICHKVLVRGASAESVKENEGKGRNILKISPESKIWFSGYMNFKRKNDKIWQKRWFVLGADFVLYSHKAKKDTKAEFTLPLPGYSVDRLTLADEVDRKNVIKLHHKNTMVHLFETENEESMNRWKELLSRAAFAKEIKEEEVRKISK